MRLLIHYNDAWESIPLIFSDDIADRIRADLQPSHPLHQVDFFPVAKVERKWRYFLEVEDCPEELWLLDMHKKKRVKGKTLYYFRKIASQEELDRIIRDDLDEWVRYMKSSGAWNE